jgi:hypothetical protein
MTMARLEERVARLEQRLGVGQKVDLFIVAESREEYDQKLAEAQAKHGPDAEFVLRLIWLADGPMPTREEAR